MDTATAQAITWGVEGLITIAFIAAGWVLVGVIKGVLKNAKDIAEYKTHVAENYASKGDLNAVRLETNQSLQRLHERIDLSDKNSQEGFKNIRDSQDKILDRLIALKTS